MKADANYTANFKGLLLKADSETSGVWHKFTSSEGASSQQPYIQITYNDSPPACQQVQSGAVYSISNYNDLMLDVQGGGTTIGTNLILYGSTGGKNQSFQINYSGNGQYSIIPQNATNMVLSVTPTGSVLIQGNNGSPQQRWYIFYRNGKYHFVNMYYNTYVMEVPFGTNNVRTGNSYENCDWELEKVNKAFNTEYTSELKSDFNFLLGSGTRSPAHYYTPSQCIDIILSYDDHITSLCNTANFAIPKAYVQSLLMRELWCVNFSDSAADYVVETYYQEKLKGNDPLEIKDDSSTGYGQIFARTAIGALNHANNIGIPTGLGPLDDSDWLQVYSMWSNLCYDQGYNIQMVYYEVLNCANKTSQPNYNFFEYNTTQKKAILSRYNGTNSAATQYGEDVYKYFLIFSQYNNH